jgi:hypothetical protein
VQFLSEKNAGLEIDEKRSASKRIPRGREDRRVEMRFGPVRIKHARGIESAWASVEQVV